MTVYIQDIYVQIYLKNDVSAIPDKTDLSILKTSYCYQLASESLVKVIVSEPCSEPPILLGDRLC